VAAGVGARVRLVARGLHACMSAALCCSHCRPTCCSHMRCTWHLRCRRCARPRTLMVNRGRPAQAPTGRTQRSPSPSTEREARPGGGMRAWRRRPHVISCAVERERWALTVVVPCARHFRHSRRDGGGAAASTRVCQQRGLLCRALDRTGPAEGCCCVVLCSQPRIVACCGVCQLCSLLDNVNLCHRPAAYTGHALHCDHRNCTGRAR
jgi:hypothetical protein